MPLPETFPFQIGSYTALRKLGQGGMGVVYRAQDASGEAVAIKMMLDKYDGNDHARRRFDREARAMERVVSEHTIRIIEVSEHDGYPFFAMEYLRGQSLQQFLDSGKPLSLSSALRIASEIAQGLADAHFQGVIHRDLKPDNVRLVSPNGTAKIIDFGLAREIDSASMLTRDGSVLGTPHFMSPEQARGEKCDYRSDLFSYGVMLYRMLCGTLPFQGETHNAIWYQILTQNPKPVKELRADLPDEAVEIVTKLLSKDAGVRPELMSGVLPGLRRLRRQFAKSPSSPVISTPRVRSEPSIEVRDPRSLPAPSAPDSEGQTRDLAPEPLDCTPKNGADAVLVKRVQKSWADYLKTPVETSVDLGGGVKMEFVFIPPGKFWMGSPETEAERTDDEGPQHIVTLTKPFYIGKYPVTQQEYMQLTGLANPSRFKSEATSKRHPVEKVSWEDAKVGWEKLAAKTLPIGFRTASLPTEAQWEYACRAGTRTAFHFGDILNGTEANCDGNRPYGTNDKGPYLKKTTPVGVYPANPFGLFDLHGNVWEWCLDGWDASAYKKEGRSDPFVDHSNNRRRVLRGGSWDVSSRICRSASRYLIAPEYRYNYLGFRLLLLP